MRTTRQVAIYCVLRENNRDFYILVKRNEKRGGFWQPLTGGEEDFDNDIYQTVIREINEELSIDVARENILDISHSFKFEDKDGVERTEQCFGVVFSKNLKGRLRLSEEHTAIIWATDTDYLKSIMKYEENRTGLEKFKKLLSSQNK